MEDCRCRQAKFKQMEKIKVAREKKKNLGHHKRWERRGEERRDIRERQF